MIWLHQDGNWWWDIAKRIWVSSFSFQWKATSNTSLMLTYNFLLHMQDTSQYLIYSVVAPCKYHLKISSYFCHPVSHWIHLPELLQTKQLPNEHVTIRNPHNQLTSVPERKTTYSTSHIDSAAKVMPWCFPQSNIRGQNLEVCFPKKPPEENRQACSTSPLTDSTLQRSHAAGHAHWSSLTRLTFPGLHGWLTAHRALPGWKGHAMPCRQCHRCPPRHPLTAISRAGKVNALRKDSHSIWEALNCKTRVCHLNLAVIHVRLVFPVAPLGGVKIFQTSG